MKRIIISFAVTICLPVLVFAQVSDSYVLTSDRLTVHQDGVYDVIMTEEQSYTQEVGNPQLPVKTISYVIPYNATVMGINVSISQQKLDGDYYIFPAQQPRRLDGSPPPPFVEPNQDVYGSSIPYPDKAAEIISDEYTHGYHIVTVAIYPVVYYPADKEIYLRNISFTINYTGTFDNRLGIPYEKISIKRAELGKQIVQNMVKNINNIESCRNLNAQLVSNSNSQNNQNNYELMSGSTSAIDAIVPDYIIITNNALKPYFQILANWKTKKGVPAIIKTIEEIKLNYNGSDLQEKIRNYLKEAYINYGPSNFVLLGGDVDIVPDRLFEKTGFATDLYYATVAGTWNANKDDIFGDTNDVVDYGYDFFLGRAPVKDAVEAQRFINKIINYEKYSGLGNNAYVNNFLALVGFLNVTDCGVFYDAGGYNFSKSIKNIANTCMPTNINKWFLFDNYDCQYNSSNPYQYPYSYAPNPTGICNDKSKIVIPGNIDNCAFGNQTLSKSNAFSCLNDGSPDLGKFHIVYHIQHSGVKGIGLSHVISGGFANNDFDDLTNGSCQQIMFSNSCKPASFNFDCFGEHYVNNATGGGVAFIGNSDNGYYDEQPQFQRFCQALFNTNNAGYHLGVAFQAAPFRNDQRRRLILLGDPEMPVWTATPQTLTANTTLSSQTANGERTVTVTIGSLQSGKKATICVWKGDDCYFTEEVTSTGSQITKTYTFLPTSNGILYVTIVSQNYKPYEWSSSVTVNAGLYISNLIFDDSNNPTTTIGNNDQQLDAGETIGLTIQLKNNNSVTVTRVSATLSCNSPYITILTPTSTFPSIVAGGTQSLTSKFRFKISENAPEILLNNLNQIKFTLQINYTYSKITISNTDKFNIEIFKPELELGNKVITQGTISVGSAVKMNIDLFNSGKSVAVGNSPTGGVTATLSSPNFATTATVNYDPVEQYGTKTSKTTFDFTITSMPVGGQPIKCTLNVTNKYGKTWALNFDLPPIVPIINDSIIGLNFNSDRTSIKLFWNNNMANVAGYNIYRCNADQQTEAEIGDYVKLNTLPFPAAFYLDAGEPGIGLPELTKYYYKISAVSAEGNESALSARKLVWTSYSLKDGFPVTMKHAGPIFSSINVAQTDYNSNYTGTKQIFAGMRETSNVPGYIIGLNHDGTEMFNINNNLTEFAGFAKVGGVVQATPAIGDINGDGIHEVLSITRNFSSGAINSLYCHSIKDNSPADGKPDLNWSTDNVFQSYRSPIIANLNGSVKSIFFGEPKNNKSIRIYNPDGSLFVPPIATPATPADFYGALAVADINNDNKKEIAGCYYSGVYVWKDDGTPFNIAGGVHQPFFAAPSTYQLKSSVVICDIDNDGIKEILTVATNDDTDKGMVLALKINSNGTGTNIWNGTQIMDIPKGWVASMEISVGDLDGDGNLEVVVVGPNRIYIWNKNGQLVGGPSGNSFIPLLNTEHSGKTTPILADVDGDSEIEIIIPTNGSQQVDAYKKNGVRVLGFPLQVSEGIIGSPCVADIDNDGKNEVIVASGAKIYVWGTDGNSDLVEWGCERANPQNTGEYLRHCTDIMIASNTTWATTQTACGNTIIQSGATLTVSSAATILLSDYSIIIQNGGKLILSGGTIDDGNIVVQNGGELIISNNGKILLGSPDNLDVQLGAIFSLEYGEVLLK